jgi:hypothetical protein
LTSQTPAGNGRGFLFGDNTNDPIIRITRPATPDRRDDIKIEKDRWSAGPSTVTEQGNLPHGFSYTFIDHQLPNGSVAARTMIVWKPADESNPRTRTAI